MSSSSMRAFLRRREKYTHVSKPLVQRDIVLVPERTVGGLTIPAITVKKTVVSEECGNTLHTGRSALKRLKRSPSWNRIAHAGG